MKKILNLFCKLSYDEFIRCFVFDDYIELSHIKDEKIFKTTKYDFIDKANIFTYLENNSTIPVEFVISNKTMNCKSVSLKNISSKDVKALVKNTLLSKGESINTICFEKKISYKSGSISISEFNLNPVLTKILEELLEIKNQIISVLTWPIWIIYSYFDKFPEDRNKFMTSIFVIENENGWEIIALYKGKFICYRRGGLENFNKNLEIENTMKYMSHMLKADPQDLAIYSITDETLKTFTFNSQINMEIISKSETLKINQHPKNFNRSIKIASCSMFLLLFTNTIADIIKIFSINEKIENCEKNINSLDKSVLSELSLWGDIDSGNYMMQANFKDTLKRYTTSEKINRLQNVSMKINDTTKKVEISAIPQDENPEG